jgi:hypothetical protein
MSKKERLEDLGRLYEMLKAIVDDEIFEHTESKHGYESWVKDNHDKIDFYDDEVPIIRGLDHIFCKMRGMHDKLSDCLAIAGGLDDD